ncbi:hypothetical protein SDC9_131929 [bioreactor metagenome]|uniref:Uncharacterized protein n=1 Tax=bioreactor metagenome TaxID=1076179 RepID=A0A645D7C8_9ZZZZ
MAIVLYLLLFAVLFNGQSATVLANPVYYLIDIIPFGMALRLRAYKKKYDEYWVINLAIVAGLFQSILAIISFLVPALQTFFVDKMVAYGYSDVYLTLSAFRMYGFASSLTSSTPIFQTLLAIISLYLASKKGTRYYLYAIVLFFSAVINARVTIVIALIGILVLIFLGKNTFKKKLILVCGVIVIVALIVGFCLPFLKDKSPLTYAWLMNGIKEINFLYSTNNYSGSYSYMSYITDSERLSLPKGISLFVGEGYSIMTSTNPSGFQSDIGYICDIWLGGLFYVLLVYTIFIRMMAKLIKTKEFLKFFVGIVFLACIPIINIKGVAFSMNTFMNYLVIFYVAVYSGGQSANREVKRW